MLEVGIAPQLPDVGMGAYLVQAFSRLRYAVPSPMGGMVAQSWTEIEAFARATEAISEPWELEALFEMSWIYTEERQAGSNLMRIPPMDRKSND
jgi:hypothetical protein